MQFFPFGNKLKVGLALGGGGVRGLSHLGILKILDKENFPIDLIAGSSMGAIIGAAYCLYKDVDFIEKKVNLIINSEEIKQLMKFSANTESRKKKLILKKFIAYIEGIYKWNLRGAKKWIIESDTLTNLIKTLIPPEKDFNDTKIPFVCAATDLFSGESVLLKKGNLLQSVLASSSIPGIFPPVKIDGRFLVDGGILSLVPVPEARNLGADFVIGVDVEGLGRREVLKNGVDILSQIDYIRAHWINKNNISQCDFLINPKVSHMNWADFSMSDYCIVKGEEAIKENLSNLKQNLNKNRLKIYIKKLFNFKKN
ncbi:MAG: patatin-like phospholipase family protein [bacterium]